ncbi:vacuolar import and degradation protein 27 [Perkinsus chesapeaki]|uniref:Vacuolar import and degradation protein 27 n=1 Tax=Perkinsus chesapeaki TaxID=330153 RepID=A0A7J6LFH4_PERCH|nr:vacuolar import and degradation protein 27 [Perkinsus chesapeaki]
METSHPPQLKHSLGASKFDGRYVLGTTAKYLVLIDTQLSGGITGFDKSMGQNAPELISISLTQEDFIKYGLKDINFTPARFESGDHGEESIVTTTGSLMVSWKLKDVLRGRTNKYSLKPMGDYIVATESAPGATESSASGSAVVAMYQDSIDLARRRRSHRH